MVINLENYFVRTMLTRAVNPSWNEGNSLEAGVEHSPDDVIIQLIGKSLDQNKGSID